MHPSPLLFSTHHNSPSPRHFNFSKWLCMILISLFLVSGCGLVSGVPHHCPHRYRLPDPCRVLYRRYYPAADSTQSEFVRVRISSLLIKNKLTASGTYRRSGFNIFDVIYVLQLVFLTESAPHRRQG